MPMTSYSMSLVHASDGGSLVDLETVKSAKTRDVEELEELGSINQLQRLKSKMRKAPVISSEKVCISHHKIF
jgi:hypothetical protein